MVNEKKTDDTSSDENQNLLIGLLSVGAVSYTHLINAHERIIQISI